MAVEIPVVVDIDKAFADAAKRVDSVMKPLEREISKNTLKLNIKIGVDEEGNAISTTFKKIKEGSIHELSTLQTAISNVRMEMIAAAEAGDKAKFTSLLEAKVYMEDMIRASQTLRLDMDGVAKTMAGLNARMSAAKATFESTRINSTEWRAAAKEIQRVTAEMDKVQRKVSEMGTKAGSIDRLNMKISELREKWDAMSRSQKFDKDGNLKASARKVVEQYKKLTDEAARFGQSLEATARGANTETKKLERNVRDVNRELEQSDSRLATLVKNSIRLLAIHSAGTFIRNIREVTSEFELQRVALASIIQDTEKAESLFKQIKAAAVESPFQIKELVTYTKQLSAYQIETEKLFDTTQKLADISAGLGVDMGRLILAFGQVRAAAVLRGQELRQFTEAGIPLVEKLAEKFSDLNGRIVSTSEVFELISKRAVPFAMIEEIFDDLTSAGGAFYQMQEKQAETLLGQWNNLKDSISIMYDEIGNTKSVHSAMEVLISDAKKVMQNWRSVATIIKFAGTQYLFLKVASAFLPTLTYNTKMLEKAEIAEARAKQLSNAAHRTGNKILDLSAKSTKAYAFYTLKAARSATQMGRAINGIKAAFLGNWMGIVISLVTVIASKFIAARKEANRLNEELSKIEGEGITKIEQSIRNFNRLADAAVNSVDGTKEQREAVDELVRTYGDLLPPADKVVDKLREMNGEYRDLTDAIRHKIDLQIQEQKIEEILSEFGTKIGGQKDTLKKILKERGFTSAEVSGVMGEIESAVKEGLISTEMDVVDQAKVIEGIIKEYTGKYIKLTESAYSTVAGTNQRVYQGERATSLSRTFSKLIGLYSEMNGKIKDVEESMKESGGVLGRYAKEWKDLQDEISKMPISGKTKFEQNESKVENYVNKAVSFIQDKFKEAKIDISGAFDANKPDFDILMQLVENIKDKEAQASMRSIIKNFKKEYEKLVPDDAITDLVKSKFKEVAASTGISMDKFTSYIKKAGQDNKEYLEDLGDSIEKFRNDADILKKALKADPKLDTARNQARIKEYNEMADALQIVYDLLKAIIPLQSGGAGAYQQDPFIQNMQDRIKFMQDFKKGYDDLKKYLSSSASMAEQSRIMEARGMALGVTPAEQKKAAEELSQWYSDAINEAFEKAKKIGAKGNLPEEFLRQQISDTSNKGKALRDFQKLIQSLWDAKTDFDTKQMVKQFDDALKRVADEIKRSETARNFYKNILDLTGDEQLATSMSVSVYGGFGGDFKERMQEQLNTVLGALDASVLTDELRKAFAKQDFKKIMASIDQIPEKYRDKLKELASDNEKYSAERIQTWLKELSEIKTYGEKRVQLARQTAERIAEIEASNLPGEQRDALIGQYKKREAEETAKLQYEAFKDSRMYVDLFEDLDAASTKMLTNMQNRLLGLKDQWKNLDPVQLRELQRRVDEVSTQLAKKNPFKVLIESIREYRELQKGGTREEADQAAIDAANKQAQEERKLEQAINAVTRAQMAYDMVVKGAGVNSIEAKSAKAVLDAKKQELATQQAATDQAKQEADAAEETADAFKGAAGHIKDATEQLATWSGYITEALGGIGQIVSTFASDDIADTFGIISDGIGKTLSGLTGIGGGLFKIVSGTDIFGGIVQVVSGIGDVIGGIFGTANALKIKRINEQIEKQQKLIDNLEKSDERLEKAMAESFGSDYIYNYTKQLEDLAAKQAAYEEQARLEREKGKKADEDKIKEYQQSAEDAASDIVEMRGQLAEFFTGTDLTSAATDFANSWIDAYKEFGSTTDAMKEKFNDMIQNMITQSLGAKIMQDILKPLFKEIDDMAKSGGELSAQEIAQIANMAPQYIEQVNNAMTTLMNQLAAAGYNVRQGVGQFTGISRDIAGASEESINGLAAGINTQNFYMSQINQNVAAILASMTGGTDAAGVNRGSAAAAEDPYKNQMLEFVGFLPEMHDDMHEVRRLLALVVKPNGTTSTHYVATRS